MPVTSIPANVTRPIRFSQSNSEPLRHSPMGARVLSTENSARRMTLPAINDPANDRATCSRQGDIELPLYSGGLVLPWEFIKDQQSFDEACASLIEHLKTRTLSEVEMLEVLKSGLLQRRLGGVLADLFADVMMRSIQPKGDLTVERLREIVEVICHLPPGRWAASMGEHVNFSRGSDSEGVVGFIQSQLELSRQKKDEKIANGELLTDDQWQRLCEVVRDSRSSIRPWREGRVHDTLSKLEETLIVRPSPKETRFLLGELLHRLNESTGGERFPDRHKRTLEALWQSIELKTAPSLLTELREGVQRVVNSTNSALNTLGSLSVNDLGSAIGKGVSATVNSAASAVSAVGFMFRSAPASNLGASDEVVEGERSLLSMLDEIERKGEFYDHVVTDGPRIPEGVAGKLLYALNALNTTGVLSTAQEVRPPFTLAPHDQAAEYPSRDGEVVGQQKIEPAAASLFEQVEQLARQVDDLLTEATHQMTGWSPVEAFDQADPRPLLQMIKDTVNGFDARTPLRASPTSSYGTSENPYRNTVVEIEQDPLSVGDTSWGDTLETLRLSLVYWLETAASYLTTAAAASLSSSVGFARQHPRTTVAAATVTITTIYALVQEFHARWFADNDQAHQVSSHFAEEADPELRRHIMADVRSVLDTLPDVARSVSARLAASSYADPHQDPRLVADIKSLLQQPAPSDADLTCAELVDESIANSRVHYAHLLISRMDVDVDGTPYVKVEDVPANSERKDLAEEGAAWVLDVVDDASSALRADRDLQTRLLERLESSNHHYPLDIPTGSLIGKPLDLYQKALNEPKVIAWFESKGLLLDTLCIRQDRVSGSVTRDGVTSTQTFNLWDTSGWWQVSAHVLAARQVLDPGNFGLPYVSEDSTLLPTNVILDFYGVVPPTTDEEVDELSSRLGLEGWPEMTADEKIEIDSACHRVTQLVAEKKSREQLSYELEQSVINLPDNAAVSLSGRHSRSADRTALSDKCKENVGYLNDFLLMPAMVELCKAVNIDCTDLPARVSDNKIQVLIRPAIWYDLTDLVSSQGVLKQPFENLLQVVKETGNALYSTLTNDLQQIVNFKGFGSPKTAAEVRNVIRWLKTYLPPVTPSGNYGTGLLLDTSSPASFTPSERATLIERAKELIYGSDSILDALGTDLFTGKSADYLRANANSLLGELFSTVQIPSWGHQLLGAINWYVGSEERTPSPEYWQQVVLAAIKLGVDPETPGKPGTIAGYDVYQPGNLGRSLGEVRADMEQHLISRKGVSPQTAPVVAHLFLADTAPEFIAQGIDEGLHVGTASWMTLRLGVAIAEIQNPGCSRAMTADELMALALLVPMSIDEKLLFDTLASEIMMTWGAMNGVIQPPGELPYSYSDYSAAASKFSTQRTDLSEALKGFKRDLVTRREIAVRELTKVLSTHTTQSIEEIKVKVTIHDPRDRLPTFQETEKSLVEAYMDGDLRLSYRLVDNPMRQEMFEWCVNQLPNLDELLTNSVNSFFNGQKKSFVISTQYLFSMLPLEDRQSIEYGEVKLFTLREETGKTQENEVSGDRAAVRGCQGTLMRCEYQQQVSYFEVFPGRMSIVKRTDLPRDLPLNGEIKIEKERVSKGGYVNVEVQRGSELPFDFSAYSQGSEPVAGAKSGKLIIEQLGRTLPASAMQAGRPHTSVPNSYFSPRTEDIVNTIVSDNFLQGAQDFLFKKAKGQTTTEENRAYWEKVANFIMQLIPFVGCTDDLGSGDRKRLINGAFGCFTDIVSGLNTLAGGVGKLSSVLKSVAPISVQAFQAIKVISSTIVSAINPLDGLLDLAAGGARAIGGFTNLLRSGVFTLTTNGIGRLQTCVDRLRGFFGGFAGSFASQASHGRKVIAVAGRVDGTDISATLENGKWYALDDSGNPFGRPLDNFISLAPSSDDPAVVN